MSADDGIYIHKFPDGWRVTHTQAIENISWKADKSGYNQKILKDYFSNSPVFKTRKLAWVFAIKLYQKAVKEGGLYGSPEYGVSEV